MRPAKTATSNSIYRDLPSVDELLRSATGQQLSAAHGERHAAALARKAIESLRQELGKNGTDRSKENLLADAAGRLEILTKSELISGTGRVINATGVVIHTNLGRAPLSDNARKAIESAAGYCTLEYDLETGKRGRRGSRAEDLLITITGAEDVLIVNNGAAAAFFVLTAFASGGEVVISRGELVEIGGDFRVPDVLAQSGSTLREVGTTNRTKLADYEKALGPNTRMILRVHPSNYKIVGFTAMPALSDLSLLAKKHKILLYEDLGSGALIDLGEFGLADEPVVSRSIAAGADVISFSGDKLLGGPQAGIIAGRSEVIEQLRKHPLYRALRIDKITNAALEATLESYRRGAATREIPVLKMLSMSGAELKSRAQDLVKRLKGKTGLAADVVAGSSVVGGGTAPDVHSATTLITLIHDNMPADQLMLKLRQGTPPVIGRIENGYVLLDLRTVPENEEAELLDVIASL